MAKKVQNSTTPFRPTIVTDGAKGTTGVGIDRNIDTDEAAIETRGNTAFNLYADPLEVRRGSPRRLRY